MEIDVGQMTATDLHRAARTFARLEKYWPPADPVMGRLLGELATRLTHAAVELELAIAAIEARQQPAIGQRGQPQSERRAGTWTEPRQASARGQ